MKKNTVFIFLVLIVLLLAMGGSFAYNTLYDGAGAGKKEADTVIELLNGDESYYAAGNITDNSSLYEENGNDVVTMYLTVRKGNRSEGTYHTWREINEHSAYYYDEKGIDRYKVEGLLQIGDEKGVSPGDFGYGKVASNATVQIRGQSSSLNPQKNYKIELRENQGSWNGQTTFALNKHMNDGLRYRNKLGFDLLSDMDQLMSLRTQFVHLYVKDLTEGEDAGFVDYGLYTQVEQLNKTALRAHGLDKTGHLYKINYFEFFRYEDVIKLETESGYDRTKFEQYLEIKGATDHSKLIAMLKDLNDYSISIEDVIQKHFDIANLTYWMAFNILTGNVDTQSRNSYLYSAQNSDTWYLYSWDLDGIFLHDENLIRKNQDYADWESGVSNYWGNVLFKRCLKSDYFRRQLDYAVGDIKKELTEEKISGLISGYRQVIDDYLYSEPDVSYAPLSPEVYRQVSDNVPSLVDYYYEKYAASIEKPMPFFIGTPTVSEGKIIFNWDESYDFQKDDVQYELLLSDDPEFKNVSYKYEGYWNSCETAALEPGMYFLKVTAKDSSGNEQQAFDYYVTENGTIYSTICFFVNEDGSTSRYTAEE